MVKPDALRVLFTEYTKYLAGAGARRRLPLTSDAARDVTRGQRRRRAAAALSDLPARFPFSRA